MDRVALHQKLEALKKFSHLDPEQIERFGTLLENQPEEGLEFIRINPFTFAEKHQFTRDEALDLFLHGAKIGLFDFDWHVICSACGGIERSYQTVNELAKDHFYCSLCQKDLPNTLDDQIEVSFNINPKIHRLKYDPYTDLDHYTNYFFSSNLKRPPELESFLRSRVLTLYPLEPDLCIDLTLNGKPGGSYRVVSLDQHKALEIQFTQQYAEGPQTQEIQMLNFGFSLSELSFPSGELHLKICNATKVRTGVLLMETSLKEIDAVVEKYPPYFLPFFTGKMLLNHQSFRELFRIQNLSEDLKLNIRSLTLLFTDLKGSTELYDLKGDVFAYGLIQEHFSLLMKVVRKYSGAIIKTMGDAIMASFSTPVDGILASIEMMQQMDALNKKAESHKLGLKIGLHEGATLAVNSDERLDYFGQTVNIAARVQGLAQAGEIWLTEPIFQTHEVQQYLASNGYQKEKRSVSLKGVGQPTVVYRCVVT